MENDLEQYLDMAFEGLEGYVYSPIKTPDQWTSKFFEFPSQSGILTDWIRANALNSDADVYISPVVYNSPHAVKETFKTSQVVWVEFDGDRYIEFPTNIPKPTAIVQTSLETHWHCYWKVDPVNSDTLEDINRRLTYYLQADQSGWDCTQLLRPPNTFNRKRSRPVLLASFSPVGKFPTEVFDGAPKIELPRQATVTPETLLTAKDVLKDKNLGTILVKQIRIETPVEPHRSSFLAKMANELAEEEFTHLEIVSCLYEIDSRIKKFTGRTDQLVRLSQIADYALAKYLAAEQITVYTPQQILEYTEELEWILEGLLHTTGQMIVSSAPGVGKTQLLLQLSYHLVTGTPFLEIGSTKSTKLSTLFMSLEMDVRTLRYIFAHHQKEWKTSFTNFNVIDEQASLAKYEKLIDQFKPNVIIIDSLGELIEDDEASPEVKARKAMRWCKRIRRHYQCAVILIHHNRKATEGNKKPKTLADLAGSYIYGKDTDSVGQLWQDHKGLEFSTVKTRFGPALEFQIIRNENLWYRRKDSVASNGPEPVQSTPKGIANLKFGFGGHGDKLHKQTGGEVPPGTSDND